MTEFAKRDLIHASDLVILLRHNIISYVSKILS